MIRLGFNSFIIVFPVQAQGVVIRVVTHYIKRIINRWGRDE
jgi:hypothetical protein